MNQVQRLLLASVSAAAFFITNVVLQFVFSLDFIEADLASAVAFFLSFLGMSSLLKVPFWRKGK